MAGDETARLPGDAPRVEALLVLLVPPLIIVFTLVLELVEERVLHGSGPTPPTSTPPSEADSFHDPDLGEVDRDETMIGSDPLESGREL